MNVVFLDNLYIIGHLFFLCRWWFRLASQANYLMGRLKLYNNEVLYERKDLVEMITDRIMIK